jgi:peroxiredoxin
MVTGVVLASASVVTAQNAFTPTWTESGVVEDFIKGYRFASFELTTNVPAGVKNLPAGLAAPLYGSFETGPASARITHVMVVDQVDGKFKRMFLDAKGGGDFSDVTPIDWQPKEYVDSEGTPATAYNAFALVNLTGDGQRRGQIKFTRGGHNMFTINYHTDCGVVGELVIGEKKLQVAMQDSQGAGEFQIGGERIRSPLVWIDVNGNGKSDPRERMSPNQGFVLDGFRWAITNLTPAGAFQVVAVGKAEQGEKKPEGPDLSPGNKAPAFTAKTVDGKEIHFPDDYKGKVVLMDFWATWCGPCVKELPNVVKTYTDYHDKGLEVLGISLDAANAEEKLTAFTKKKNMPWPQVYDGKYWNAEVAKLYGIQAIPHMLLVDGDTGLILADSDIRGEALAPAVEKALAARKNPAKAVEK